MSKFNVKTKVDDASLAKLTFQLKNSNYNVVQEGKFVRLRCTVFGCIYWHPNPAMLPFPKDSKPVPPPPKRSHPPGAVTPSSGLVAAPSGVQSRMNPGFFKSLELSVKENEIVADLNLIESKSVISKPNDVVMSNPEESPDDVESRNNGNDIDMSKGNESSDEDVDMEENPVLSPEQVKYL